MLFVPSHRGFAPARVVVTGAGIVSALGVGWERNAAGFRSGRQAFRPVTLFDVSQQRVRLAAQVDLPEQIPHGRLSNATRRRLDRAAKMLLLAAHESWNQAGWQPQEQLPLVLGTTSGGMMLGEAFLRQALAPTSSRRGQSTRIIHYNAQQLALNVAESLGFQGPIVVIANACASGANAVGHAFELVRSGQCERALTGGFDGLCQLTFAGFDALQVLSPSGCRPFAADRDGLTLGEGAAILALENFEHARKRNAPILGEIIGYGQATDNHHLTQPHPEGKAALAAMADACAQAQLMPEEVGYINAHGTATPQNDATEARAISRWAGARAGSLPVSSTKTGIGHLLGAAGAVEAVATLMALQGQWLPPERDIGVVDSQCAFSLVREPMDAPIEVALSNSFGFGGANATLAFRRWS